MSHPPAEGAVKFQATHRSHPLEPWVYGETARDLAAWREILARLGLIGQDSARYQGLGFGNLSARVGPFGAVPRGQRRFLVTGTQTGAMRHLSIADFCVVERYDIARAEVRSFGPRPPSSESLTHAALYDIAPAVHAILHGHSPEIWRAAKALGIPATRPAAAYGTPEMASEVQRLYKETAASGLGIVAMGGHEDGVIAFAANPGAAGEILVRHLARACALEGR